MRLHTRGHRRRGNSGFEKCKIDREGAVEKCSHVANKMSRYTRNGGAQYMNQNHRKYAVRPSSFYFYFIFPFFRFFSFVQVSFRFFHAQIKISWIRRISTRKTRVAHTAILCASRSIYYYLFFCQRERERVFSGRLLMLDTIPTHHKSRNKSLFGPAKHTHTN